MLLMCMCTIFICFPSSNWKSHHNCEPFPWFISKHRACLSLINIIIHYHSWFSCSIFLMKRIMDAFFMKCLRYLKRISLIFSINLYSQLNHLLEMFEMLMATFLIWRHEIIKTLLFSFSMDVDYVIIASNYIFIFIEHTCMNHR